MTWHPRERGATRRDFLMRSGGAALGLTSAGSLLAACGNSTTPTASSNAQGEPVGPSGLPLARMIRRTMANSVAGSGVFQSEVISMNPAPASFSPIAIVK